MATLTDVLVPDIGDFADVPVVEIIVAVGDRSFTALGTDGFGRSDRRAALRRFFEVDRHHVVVAALRALGEDTAAATAIDRYGLDTEVAPPWQR